MQSIVPGFSHYSRTIQSAPSLQKLSRVVLAYALAGDNEGIQLTVAKTTVNVSVPLTCFAFNISCMICLKACE